MAIRYFLKFGSREVGPFKKRSDAVSQALALLPTELPSAERSRVATELEARQKPTVGDQVLSIVRKRTKLADIAVEPSAATPALAVPDSASGTTV